MSLAPAGGIFLSCGEVSGDMYAASLVLSLRANGYDGPLSGMVGERSAAAGVEIVRDSRALHLMGVGEVIPAIPRLLSLKRNLASYIVSSGVRAAVFIDSPDFHLPLLSHLRSIGWRGGVVYVVPPTVWAWRGGRVKALVRDTDLCLPLFGFEHEYLTERGVKSAWLGHPMAGEFPERPSPPSGGRVALLPGSRRSEITRLLPPLIDCARMLLAEGLTPVFSIAPGIAEDMRDWMRSELRGYEVFEGDGRELLESCAAAAGASGTAAVEAMMLDRFMAVMYRVGLLSRLVWTVLGGTRRVSLPNILSEKDIYPELLQGEATGENAFREIIGYMNDSSRRKTVHEGLAAARGMMGRPGAADFWARAIMSLLEPEGRAAS